LVGVLILSNEGLPKEMIIKNTKKAKSAPRLIDDASFNLRGHFNFFQIKKIQIGAKKKVSINDINNIIRRNNLFLKIFFICSIKIIERIS